MMIIMLSMLSFAQDKVDDSSVEITVCGMTRGVDVPRNSSAPYKIYISEPKSDPKIYEKFAIVIWQNDISTLEINPPSLVGSNLCITGIERLYYVNSSYESQIFLKNYNQLSFIPSSLSSDGQSTRFLILRPQVRILQRVYINNKTIFVIVLTSILYICIIINLFLYIFGLASNALCYVGIATK